MTLQLGDIHVPPYGLGTLPLGVRYNKGGRPDRAEAIRIVHAALNAGVRFIDTADVYCAEASEKHYTEKVVKDALATWSGDTSEVVVATKGGMSRHGDGTTPNSWAPLHNMTPATLETTVKESSCALGMKPIHLWQFHHVDSWDAKSTKYAELLGKTKELIDSGWIRVVGLCNTSVQHVEVARGILGGQLVSVQNEFNLYCLQAWKGKVSEAKTNRGGLLPYCQQHGIAFMPYGALGGHKARSGVRDLVRDFPDLVKLASGKGVSPYAVVLAWMRQTWPCVLHIVGARSVDRLAVSDEAQGMELSTGELDIISKLKKPPGAK